MVIWTINNEIIDANSISLTFEDAKMSSTPYVLRNEKGILISKYFTKRQAELALEMINNSDISQFIEALSCIDTSLLKVIGYKVGCESSLDNMGVKKKVFVLNKKGEKLIVDERYIKRW